MVCDCSFHRDFGAVLPCSLGILGGGEIFDWFGVEPFFFSFSLVRVWRQDGGFKGPLHGLFGYVQGLAFRLPDPPPPRLSWRSCRLPQPFFYFAGGEWFPPFSSPLFRTPHSFFSLPQLHLSAVVRFWYPIGPNRPLIHPPFVLFCAMKTRRFSIPLTAICNWIFAFTFRLFP